MDRFQLDKRVANLICDMDFLVQDNPDKSQTKFNRLVKRSNKHLVLITYELRQRLIVPPTPEDNPELIT